MDESGLVVGSIHSYKTRLLCDFSPLDNAMLMACDNSNEITYVF